MKISKLLSLVFLLFVLANNPSWAQVTAVTPNTVPGGYPSDEKPALGGSIVRPPGAVAGGIPSDEKPAEGGSAVRLNAVAGGMPSDEQPAAGGSAVKPNGIAGGLPSDEQPADGKIGGPLLP